MSAPESSHRSKLWIVRLQMFMERFIPSSLLASAVPFALPLTVAGILIGRRAGIMLLSRGVVFALVWLAIAPWLVTAAHRTVARFFDENRPRFVMDDEHFHALRARMLRELESPKHLIVAIPFTLLCGWVLLSSIYATPPTLVRVWVGVTFGVLFMAAGTGFWGILRFGTIFSEVCKQELRFDPYHADGFGGLGFLGQFNAKGPQFFFSGALIFPIVLEIVDTLPPNGLISLGLWGAVAAFLAFGLYGFFAPQMKIKDIIARSKEEHLLRSECVLQTLLAGLFDEACGDKDRAKVAETRIDVYYEYFHKRIAAVKEWPFDWKVVVQMLSSLTVPIMVALAEYFLR